MRVAARHQRGARLLGISTPWIRSDWFWDERQDPAWTYFAASVEDTQAIPAAFLAADRHVLGEQAYAREYLLAYVSTDTLVFSPEALDALFGVRSVFPPAGEAADLVVTIFAAGGAAVSYNPDGPSTWPIGATAATWVAVDVRGEVPLPSSSPPVIPGRSTEGANSRPTALPRQSGTGSSAVSAGSKVAEVQGVRRSDLPTDAPVAAILRYAMRDRRRARGIRRPSRRRSPRSAPCAAPRPARC